MKRYACAFALTMALAATASAQQPSGDGPPGNNQPNAGVTPATGPAQLSPEEMDVLREIENDFKRWESAANGHHNRIRQILFREYEDRKLQLERRYAERIDAAEKEEHKRRLEAIALLENFIREYPDHKQFTPDAMFRLADLYLDQANYEFEVAFDTAAEANENAAPPPADDDTADDTGEPIADYSKSLALWTKIISDFPEYRQRPGTLYLLAYYSKQTGDERRALQVARSLACSNKYNPLDEPPPAPSREEVRAIAASGDKPEFVDPYTDCKPASDDKVLIEDTWVRLIGDIHFLTPGELNEAITSYKRVAVNKKSKFYDEALYKLAWSYYRNDDFLLGIQSFDESIVYSDSLVAQGKDPLDLRPEALQYIAISFTDPWTVEEQADPVKAWERAFDFYKERLTEPHVRDVFIQLGDTFEILEAKEQAVDSWRIAIDKFPLHPTNPVIHQKIVSMYESIGDRDLADEEAARLAKRYAPGTEWYTANETNREAMEAQRMIGQRALRGAAENTHKAAQQARQDWKDDPTEEKRQRYISLYQKAAELYQRYITENPTAPEVYEFTYRLGETSFFAGDYLAAVEHYRWVRDARSLSSARFEKAALSVVQSYAKEVEREIAAGQLTEPPLPDLDALKKMPKPIKPLSVPKLYADYRNALDEYMRLVNDPKTAPDMGYNAAAISYRHLDLADAEKRFQATLKRFCGSTEATKSKDGLLAIYEARGEDAKFRKTNEAFISQKCGSEDDLKVARAQNRSKKFREAEDLADEGKANEAALAFYRYYKQAPEGDVNLPIALYNAGLQYDKAGKPKTAVYLYKELTSKTDKLYTESPFYLSAMYLTAVSYNNAFDYDNAVKTYLKVVKLAADPKRPAPQGVEVTKEQMRVNALFNAALIRELDRVYKDPRNAPGTGAVTLYRRYIKLEKDRKKRDRAVWAIARIYQNAGDLKNLEKTYGEWRSSYGRDPGNADDYVFTYYNMVKLYQKKGSRYRKQAAAKKKATIQAWKNVGSPKASPAATMAAEFDFENAEAAKKAFDKFKIKSAPKTEKAGKAVLAKLDKLANDSVARYNDLAKYESGVWGLAALVRIGDVRYFQGLKIKEIPAPKELVKMQKKYPDKDILVGWEDALDQLVVPLEKQAKTQWVKVKDAGKAQGVANEWTALAQERLHDFISAEEFPVLRQELINGTEEP